MITDLRLQHFRSYQDVQFQFSPGVTIIVGPNASGKTNLLEAVLVVARGHSYRAKDNELLGHDAPWARLDATLADSSKRIVKFIAEPSPSKTFEINEQVVMRLHQSKTLPVVLFEPNHLLLMSGSPDLRRTFLDDLIEQTEPDFVAIRRHYKRVLSQRNALLKKNPKDLTQQLFVWNIRLSELGGQIAKRRHALTMRFNQHLPELYRSLATKDNQLSISYTSRFSVSNYESQLLHKLESSTELDVLRGFTASGPHRDDVSVVIDGKPLQETASRGETRTLVLALKILELQLLEEARHAKPILLLDDVFSELDATRRQALTKYVEPYQTFITTTDADVIAKHFTKNNKILLT